MSAAKAVKSASVLDGLEERRAVVRELEQKRSRLQAERDKARMRRAVLEQQIADERGSAKLAEPEREPKIGELLEELERIGDELGQDALVTRDRAGSSHTLQRARPGALPAALAQLEGAIMRAERAVAEFHDEHRDALVEHAHSVAADEDKARAEFCAAAGKLQAAHRTTRAAYELAFDGARLDLEPFAKFGLIAPHLPDGVPVDRVVMPDRLIEHLAGADRARPDALLDLVVAHYRQPAKPAGYVGDKPHSIPGIYEKENGRHMQVTAGDLHTEHIRRAVTPDPTTGAARYRWVAPLPDVVPSSLRERTEPLDDADIEAHLV